jgi:pimeloyl-ACP methyl ester carboxylesterase
VADRYIELPESPLAPGVSPVRIHYLEAGAGPPLMMLHGGWGYDIYPFDRQIAAFAPSRRIVIPDRSGYGGSGRLITQEIDFHRRAAEETFAVIDALALERPILWGHSDGAVIALLMGLASPERIGGLILEAAHLFRRKPASRAFFELMRDNPDGLGERVTSVLAREHGDGWRHLISTNGAAWLRLAELGGDLYDGRLPALQVPVLVIHGTRDPRTEPGELDALREALEGRSRQLGRSKNLRHFSPVDAQPDEAQDLGADDARASVAPRAVVAQDFSRAVRFEVLLDGGHSPHSAPATADDVTRAAAQFVSALGSGLPGSLDRR